jgi:hypothetical protein
LRSLADTADVVPVLQPSHPPVHHGLGPADVHVAVGVEVHQVDDSDTGWPGRDLPEDHLAVRLAVPLHVGEPCLEPERGQHLLAHPPAALEVRDTQVAQRDRHRADPLVQSHLERSRAVPQHVLEQDAAARAHGVVGELLGLDELLHADLGHVPQQRQHLRQGRCRVHPVGVRRSRPGDGFDDQRIADLLGGLPHPCHRGRARVPGGADASGVERSLHQLLVTEGQRLLHGHAGKPERLPHPSSQDHVRLPQTLDLVDAHVPRQAPQGREHRILVGQ